MAEYYKFRMDRMLEYGWMDDPWGDLASFHLDMIGQGTSEEAIPFSWGNECGWEKTGDWHAGRIRHLISHPKELSQPIEVDCECSQNRILALPLIVDGWHRFLAHIWTKAPIINATFGGLVDLREYLEGVTDTRPPE